MADLDGDGVKDFVLGFRQVAPALVWYQRVPGGWTRHVLDESLKRGKAELHVTRVPDLDPATSMSACYLYVDDADALFAQWSAAGAAGRLVAPRDTEYGLREMAHVDPDGNLLRVGSPMKTS